MACGAISRICGFLASVLAGLWALTAQAQTELYDADLGRYFLSVYPDNVLKDPGGQAARGWVTTGYSFYEGCDATGSLACDKRVPVCRFYGAPPVGSRSHFFTADPGECAFLRQNPAWQFEGTPFSAFVPDGTTHTCASGLIPVYRFFNNAATATQVRHRWSASHVVRDRMIALGWKEEGIAFCARQAAHQPLRSFAVPIYKEYILTSEGCAAQVDKSRACLGTNNLPALHQNDMSYLGDDAALFFDNSGIAGDVVYSVAGPSPADAAADTFVTLHGLTPIAPDSLFFSNFYPFSVHISTKTRGPANLTSVNPLYQFQLFAPPEGEYDARFTPFAGQYDTDVDVVLSFNMHLKKLRTTPESAAYGHATLDLWDRASNLHFYLVVLAYGTVSSADNVIRDGPAGNPIVVTAFRESQYGRNYFSRVMDTPAPFDWEGIGAGGYFEFHINTAEFQRAVAAARTIEPRLSTNLADYAVDDFLFNSEIAGDGEIGENFSAINVYLVPTGQRPFYSSPD